MDLSEGGKKKIKKGGGDKRGDLLFFLTGSKRVRENTGSREIQGKNITLSQNQETETLPQHYPRLFTFKLKKLRVITARSNPS